MIARLLLIILLSATPGSMFAHALRVFATTQTDGAITGYAYAQGGSRIVGQTIALENADGTVLSTTRSSPDGTFRFDSPPAAARLVVVELPDGHRGQFRLPRSSPSAAAEDEAATTAEHAALRARVVELEREVRLRDVIGGIGYIVGLTGLLAWWQARRQPPAPRGAP